jgi:hypothetical protein
MKYFYSTKPKYSHLFKTTIILINFLHKCQMDFTNEVLGGHINDSLIIARMETFSHRFNIF